MIWLLCRSDSAVLSGLVLMLFTTIVWLKLVSYAHTNYDLRNFPDSDNKVIYSWRLVIGLSSSIHYIPTYAKLVLESFFQINKIRWEVKKPILAIWWKSKWHHALRLGLFNICSMQSLSGDHEEGSNLSWFSKMISFYIDIVWVIWGDKMNEF